MRSERMDLRVYRALFNALRPGCRAFGWLFRFGSALSAMVNESLESPLAVARRAIYKRPIFWGAIDDLKCAFAQLDPEFTQFLDTAAHSGWIDAHGQSMKTGGTWCDDLPALDAVRILANYLPTLSGEAALSHLLGAAWHMQVLHQAPLLRECRCLQ